ncbi:MAG: ATP-dependent Clp protease proteolytic subunit, partial [Actinobacteria bacterium]|nr:ATP-dependent Clp protease proteolytic subunit [Actinomycetota bacterium]
VLIHQPYAQSGYAQVSDLEIAANEIIRLKETLEHVLSRHTGQPVEKISKDTDRDYVMTASEAKEYGIIDEVIEARNVVDNSGPIAAIS